MDFSLELLTDDILDTFNELDQLKAIEKHVNIKSKYLKDGKPIMYDSVTMKYYISMREMKFDPILEEAVDLTTSFVFLYQWDPYTGVRKEYDPYGSLYFDPLNLVRMFHVNRLRNLWVDESDEEGGYYSGYYDCCLGSGKDMEVVGRGSYKSSYPFRLPITNCYLEENAEKSIITMGPELTDDEVRKIYSLACLRGISEYNKIFKTSKSEIPNIVEIKSLYDKAISKTPCISQNYHTVEEIKQLKHGANINAVERLKKL
jgi:hypothetical protein